MKSVSLTLSRPFAWLARVDLVFVAMVLILGIVALIEPSQVPQSLEFTARAVLKTSPFLVASVALAAYAKASGSDSLISHAFQGSPIRAIFTAAFMGALSPFCSCGVIPVIAALLSMGVPLGPVMAFWLASPLMDPSMFLLTSATLGAEFAIAKTVAAIGVGLLGGFGSLLLVKSGWIGESLREGVGNGGCAASKIRAPKAVVWAIWHEPERLRTMGKTASASATFLGKWLLLAFLLESLMVAWMPNDLIAHAAGGEGMLPIAAATFIGIPSYLNGYAALPLVKGLLESGLAPGAAMAFLVSGGITSMPAAMAVWAIARPRVFCTYIGAAVVGALIAGAAYGAWIGIDRPSTSVQWQLKNQQALEEADHVSREMTC